MSSNQLTPSEFDDYDVVVIGGAFSGASSALMLRRQLPDSRILIVESSKRFGRRVGEATVEISACFLHRVLRLNDHLSREHLPKHGLRFWFTDSADRSLEEMTEIGPRELPKLPSFQLDRSKLDEHLLALAKAEGCEVMRPAKVIRTDQGWPETRVHIEGEVGAREVRARWVVDATGRHAFLGRRLRLRRRVERHPTAAIWSRWSGVADFDGPEVLGGDPNTSRLAELVPSRRLATNHFCGYGWWCWVIPLSGGETSIGLVYNKELFSLAGQGSILDRYREFITSQAGLRELLANARLDEEDFMSYSHLAYTSSQYMGRGWAMVGDAAGFIDPYYSPGLDHASISVYATMRLIQQNLTGELEEADLESAIDKHNKSFQRSYDRWLDALYQGKYEILGDSELTQCAFLADTALYYLGVVRPVYQDSSALANPLFGLDDTKTAFAFRLIQAYNRRLFKLARIRRHAGTYGQGNVGRRSLSNAFSLDPRSGGAFLWSAFKIWGRLEVQALGHRLRHGRRDISRPVPQADPKIEALPLP